MSKENTTTAGSGKSPREIGVYNAPSGAGKTSTMKKAVRNLKNKKVLIIVYNKTNQEALMTEMKDCIYCTVKTLDALCMTAISSKMGTLIQNENFDEDATVF